MLDRKKVDPALATGRDPAGPTADTPDDPRYADGRRQVKVRQVRLVKVRKARGATRR